MRNNYTIIAISLLFGALCFYIPLKMGINVTFGATLYLIIIAIIFFNFDKQLKKLSNKNHENILFVVLSGVNACFPIIMPIYIFIYWKISYENNTILNIFQLSLIASSAILGIFIGHFKKNTLTIL